MSAIPLAPPEFWLGFGYGVVAMLILGAALWAVYWPMRIEHPLED